MTHTLTIDGTDGRNIDIDLDGDTNAEVIADANEWMDAEGVDSGIVTQRDALGVVVYTENV